MYLVELSKPAAKSFHNLDPRYKNAAKKALLRLQYNPRIGEPLKQELKGLWKLRFSRYRIIYHIKDEILLVLVIAIGHRHEVYR